MRNVLVISSSEWPVSALKAALGDDVDELRVVVPAVHQSRLQWLTNADEPELGTVADTYESKYGARLTAREGTWFGLGDAIRNGEVLRLQGRSVYGLGIRQGKSVQPDAMGVLLIARGDDQEAWSVGRELTSLVSPAPRSKAPQPTNSSAGVGVGSSHLPITRARACARG